MPISTIGTASISGLGYGFKNRIINGGMSIDQRNAGAAQTVTASNVYCVDRWVTIGTVTNGSVQRVSADNVNQYAIRLLRSSGTSTGYIALHQTIETANCFDLAGQPVSISFRARKGSAYSPTVLPQVLVVTGSGTDQGSNGVTGGQWTNYASTAVTLTGTLTTSFSTFTGTVTVPAGTNEVAVFFSTGAFAGTGSSNDYLDITGVQLEKGSTATSFDYRPYGTELALCQRYYQIVVPNSGTTGSGFVNGTTQLWTSTTFKTTMRAASTVSITGTISGVSTTWSGSSLALTSYTVSTQTTDATSLYGVVASGLTAGQGGFLTMGASNQVVASAEL